MKGGSVLDRIEKLGVFYLGREYDLEEKKATAREIMYDARDLTTHAVCLGMTGSGKTGLCIDLLEEAALDRVPALIVDPKGDITNLMLTFPELRAGDFRPWVNIDDARRKDLTVDEYAEEISAAWREGLESWGQGPERIRALKESAEFRICTPGSDAGIGISILSALTPPDLDWRSDAELIREQMQGVVSALLGLLGIEADPLQSREYILLSSIVEHYWRKGEGLDLPILITSVQKPPVEKLGVFDTEVFFPEKERMKFALALNAVVASPGFQSWLEGEPLDIGSMLRSPEGRPRHTIVYLAHLPESQRMFFVTLLLEKTLAWVRSQTGTTSLRALLYFDEVYGYLPPVAEPPSKKPLLTLLKQARAFGLGVVLTTQNPVDLDYKGLTNAGTWFIGRLQAERDKTRLLEGLESISAESGSGFDRKRMDGLISSLGSRVFLLHNVHEDAPVVFQTRWAMSYLRGPMSRDQIRQLRGAPQASPPRSEEAPALRREPEPAETSGDMPTEPPVLPAGAKQTFLPPTLTRGQALGEAGASASSTASLVYEPGLLAMGLVTFLDRKSGVSETVQRTFLLSPEDFGLTTAWEGTEITGVPEEDLSDRGEPGSSYEGIFPKEWTSTTAMKSIEKDFRDFLYYCSTFGIASNPALELYGKPGEKPADFRARCEERARELRDAETEKLREATEVKLQRLKVRLEKEEMELEEDRDVYRGRQREELLSAGETLAGALGLFGSRSSRGLSSAARRRRMTVSAKADIKESEAEIDRLKEEMEDLEKEVKEKAEEIASRWEETLDAEEPLELKPRRTDVRVQLLSPVWIPSYRIEEEGRTTARIPARKDAGPPDA
jgi:hypothetical protein